MLNVKVVYNYRTMINTRARSATIVELFILEKRMRHNEQSRLHLV